MKIKNAGVALLVFTALVKKTLLPLHESQGR